MPPSLQLQGHRLQLYGVFSTVLVSAVIASAFHKHSNFYSATVFLSRSSASVMVLANYGGFLTLLFGRLVQHIFFGRLTNQEVERLYDRTWFFLTESLLAFTIFRDEFDAPFVVMFGALLFLKCFHWLIADRMDWMDQQPYPGPSWLFHIRTNVMFAILWTVDILMLDFAVESVLAHGVSGIILFGSEYAILLATLGNSVMKYGVMTYDLRRARSRGGEDAPVWENKSMYMFYIELVTDFLKLTTYLAFFTIVMTFFGLPLNIIRDVYMTGVSFYTRFRDLLRYRAATKDMETKYPDATEAELEAMSDRTCIICREEMTLSTPRTQAQAQAAQQPADLAVGPTGLPQPGQTIGLLRDPPKKLHCGHVFHFQCLRSWLERQQSCPTCRRSVLETDANGQPQQQAQQQQQQGRRQPQGQNAPAPAPGAVPQPPAQGVPAVPGGAGGQAPAANANNRSRGLAPGNNGLARSRSPAAAAPRAFQGFSVGGEWHAWQAPGFGDATQTVQPTPTAAASASTSAGRPEDDATSTGSTTPTRTGANPTPATQTVAPTTSNAVAPATAVTPADTPATEEPSDTLSPREAAAAAALRRLGGVASSFSKPASPSTDTPSPSANTPALTEQPPTPTRTSSTPPTSASSAPSTSEPSHAQASTSQPAASSSSSPPTTSNNKSVSLPPLIPLFDPSSVANRPFINISTMGLGFDIGASTPLTGPLSAGAVTPGGVSSRARTYSTSSLSAFAQANANGSFPWSVNAGLARTPAASISPTPMRVPSTTSLTSLNPTPQPTPAAIPQLSRAPSAYFTDPDATPLHIPNVLTDETQLRRLDAWTREAIDERLRVLEDVQQSLWRAAEELQRVRSTIPATPAASVPPTPSTEMGTGGGIGLDVKGKGRAVFDVQEEPEPEEEYISVSPPDNKARVSADPASVEAANPPSSE